MNHREVVQELADLIGMSFDPEVPITDLTSIRELGIDSLEVIELVLILEQRWPAAETALDDVSLDMTISDLAKVIEPHA